MHGIRSVLLCLLLLPATVALSKDIDMSACQYEFDATNAALGMRDHGKTKADLEATLPPRAKTRNDPRAILLHAILDDIYARPDVAAFPYFHYRGMVCLTRAQGIDVRIPFSRIADDLVACQDRHGTDKSEALGDCISEAVQKHL